MCVCARVCVCVCARVSAYTSICIYKYVHINILSFTLTSMYISEKYVCNKA